MRNTLLFTLLVVIAIIVRVGLSLIACDIVDVQNYERVAITVLNQGIFALYAQTSGIYPYPPLWVWFEMIAKTLSAITGLKFGLLIRVPSILADVGIVCLLWAWYYRQTRARWILSMVYALNPVSLTITCLHGQFDAIPAFFSLLTVYGLEQLRRPYLSAIALSLGIAFKSYPVLLLPSMLFSLQSYRRLAFVAIALIPVVLLILPFFFHTPGALTQELLMYKGAALLGMLVPVRSVYVPLKHEHFPLALTREIIATSRWLFLGGYIGLVLWQVHRHQSLATRCAITLLWFYVAYAGIAPQYLIWVLPFLLVLETNPFFVGLYPLTALLALYGFYVYAVPDTFCFLPFPPAWLTKVAYGLFGTLWWFTVGMLLVRIIKSK